MIYCNVANNTLKIFVICIKFLGFTGFLQVMSSLLHFIHVFYILSKLYLNFEQN